MVQKDGQWGPLKRSLAWLPAIAWAGLIFLISSQPKATFVELGLSGTSLSTAGHLITYGVLMVLLAIAWHVGSRLPANQSYLIAFLLIALYGLSDEYHQSFVPGRTPTLWDWLIDLIGAGLAWLAMVHWERRTRQQPLGERIETEEEG